MQVTDEVGELSSAGPQYSSPGSAMSCREMVSSRASEQGIDETLALYAGPPTGK